MSQTKWGDETFVNEVAKAYQLHYSAWSPDQGIPSLIKELKHVGPIAIGGCHWSCFFTKKNPYKLMKNLVSGLHTLGKILLYAVPILFPI